MKGNTVPKKTRRKNTEVEHLRSVLDKVMIFRIKEREMNEDNLRFIAEELSKINAKFDALLLRNANPVGGSH
jgi:hypothetical protein